MSAADVYRSTPGYVYSVGTHSSRMEEGTPPCACPCHLAQTPRGAKGWWCDICHSGIMIASYPEQARVEYSHEQAIADGTANPRPYMVMIPDYYFITKGNTLRDELGQHFDSSEEAEARATELNRADVLASLNLDSAFAGRRERLQQLGETFWVRYGDGHPEARWPKDPGRYALHVYSERYSESFWETHETLDEVRSEIEREGDNVSRVVDLDTGEDVPFSVTVEIGERQP